MEIFLTKTLIRTAEITWNEHNHPFSSVFNDHYYSQKNGLAETEHVFIKGNDLLERWSKLSRHQTFCIMETGFGSGLNFLATWKLWKTMHSANCGKLHFISVEKYPMDITQLEKSMENWQSSLQIESGKLLAKYPSLDATSHHLEFAEDNLTLTLIFSDIRELMPKFELPINQQVDAWFLDGFAPSQNPQMWQQDLYTQMYRLSRTGSTVATYTVAGIVRRGLTAAGFEIFRKPGFGTKRDMLAAIKP